MDNWINIMAKMVKMAKKDILKTYETYDLIYPHLNNIGEQLKKISTILKIKKSWCLIDLYFKTDGKKFLINEFRIRKLDR